ncbi:hypothetical protein COLSTE_02029 [Collinsella stercoris DSM 13279]|uniref:Uncharacterized protein n=1 Tax=Collinsella stercoris DSM 13279 TaxID=445975 RepID=B6GD51_9ACTN|nr:hypothetical protein COLSTE_02029 [Collinsella stercoris DSM 13279]
MFAAVNGADIFTLVRFEDESLTFSYAARKPNRWHGRDEFTRMGAVITLGRTRHTAISQARPRQRASRHA